MELEFETAIIDLFNTYLLQGQIDQELLHHFFDDVAHVQSHRWLRVGNGLGIPPVLMHAAMPLEFSFRWRDGVERVWQTRQSFIFCTLV